MGTTVLAATAPAQQSGLFNDPVFVLCCGRSGSTLLRFLLDAHPDLACPPETNMPALCAQLATVWSLIEGAPLSDNRGDEPPVIPDAAIEGIRHMMDMMVGSYLGRRGRKRYCDKSLGTARYADLLVRVYPEVRFICVYRHPMDVISSALEASPWGLSGYGFDPYIAETPGNSVNAMARFWLDNVSAIAEVERRFPDRCHRVRYEDLVADPETTAGRLFEFLDLAPAPGVSDRCFSLERERFGPGDHKIWYTSAVTTGSVGRGWSVPAGMIPPPVISAMNDLAAGLGYIPVTADWGTTEPPASLLAAQTRAETTAPPPGPPFTGAVAAQVDHPALRAALGQGLAKIDSKFRQKWTSCLADTFVVISVPGGASAPAARYRVDVAALTVVADEGTAADESSWDVIGSATDWESVIDGRTNLSVALRACQLRYCDSGGADPRVSRIRLSMLADLLGLTGWN